MFQYLVIEAQSKEKLGKLINKFLREQAQLVGGICVYRVGEQTFYCQSIVKPIIAPQQETD